MIIIDAGHGGLIEGEYVTPGKRFYDNSIRVAEGALNRAVANMVAYLLHCSGTPCHLLCPENEDIPLKYVRTGRANAIAKRHKSMLISIHHNAAASPYANGVELFTSYGDTAADPLAEYMAMEFGRKYPHRKFRGYTPNKRAKEANFWIIAATICPAILTEFGFMTSDTDRHLYMTPQGIMEESVFLADCLIEIDKML